MNGYGSHTYQWINAAGGKVWIKYHFHSQQGVKNITHAQAAQIASADTDYYLRDLFNAIERGDNPKWTVSVQIMPYEDAKTYHFNPFDLTKVWPHADYPLIKVGEFELNRNPENYFAQIEQAAFEPSNLVPGIDVSPDKMLLARIFSYADAHRYRIGANYNELPVNRPKTTAHSYARDGQLRHFYGHAKAPVYAPNSFGGPVADPSRAAEGAGWQSDGELVRSAYTLRTDDDDFSQPGALVRNAFDDAQRTRLVETLVGQYNGLKHAWVRERFLWYWNNIDPGIAERVRGQVAQPVAAK